MKAGGGSVLCICVHSHKHTHANTVMDYLQAHQLVHANELVERIFFLFFFFFCWICDFFIHSFIHSLLMISSNLHIPMNLSLLTRSMQFVYKEKILVSWFSGV